MPIVRIENPQVFVGLSVTDATSQIRGHGYEPCLEWADGITIASNKDYDPLRVNLRVKANVVIKATIG